MKHFKEFLTEKISIETKKLTEFLVDTVYSKYIEKYSKNSVECVGWLDGHETKGVNWKWMHPLYDSLPHPFTKGWMGLV